MRHLLCIILLLPACVLGLDDDDDDDSDDLTSLEWSMVGTWKGATSGGKTAYYVFTDDRRGCFWDRHDDDFGQRHDEVQFRNWALDADAMDQDAQMPLHFDADGGNHHDHDRYDFDDDRILLSGIDSLKLSWADLLIDCDDKGTDAVATDVERLGLLGNGLTGDGEVTGPGGIGTSNGTVGPGGGPGTASTGNTPPTGPGGGTHAAATGTADTGTTDTGGGGGPSQPAPP